MEKLDCLSNLVSLISLQVSGCRNLRSEGLWPLVAHGRLTELRISGTPKFFTGSELLLPQEEECRSYSSKLKSLDTDDLAGVLTHPICSLISSSLTTLTFSSEEKVERFTKEQEDALHLLNSLQELNFHNCRKLQRLPAGLTNLTNLKRFWIWRCSAIQLLSMDGFPSSLETLEITNCPAIKSLPKERLPSSLRELYLSGEGISEELKRQCRKLSGTIPIIKY
jgi:Leucine-rich repeat (LRR) protein